QARCLDGFDLRLDIRMDRFGRNDLRRRSRKLPFFGNFEVSAEPLDHRRKITQRIELIDNYRQRGAQRDECAAGLGDLAELNFAGEKRWRENEIGQQRQQEVVRISEERQVPLPRDKQIEVFYRRVQTLQQLALFAPFAAVKRDRFRVIP